MAKGRKLTSSRSERLLGVGNYNHYGHVPNAGDVSDMFELGEDDVWSMVEQATTDHHEYHHGSVYGGGAWDSRASIERGRMNEVTSRHDARHVGGLSLAFEDDHGGTMMTSHQRIVHQFAGANSNTVSGDPRNHKPNGGSHRGVDRRHMATSAPVNVPDWRKILRVDSVESMHDSDEDDRVGDSGMEPPHEYLARSRKTNAFSVYEGVGRTLKGRDMSRVRDAVWSQTGFEG